jgi:hypothetical protein
MPKFVIEHDLPTDRLSTAALNAISQRSCNLLGAMGPQIQWLESYVTADTLREHAKRGGFPATRVSEVKRMIDPTTAE